MSSPSLTAASPHTVAALMHVCSHRPVVVLTAAAAEEVLHLLAPSSRGVFFFNFTVARLAASAAALLLPPGSSGKGSVVLSQFIRRNCRLVTSKRVKKGRERAGERERESEYPHAKWRSLVVIPVLPALIKPIN